jgi:hypothetical protein
VRVGRVRRAKSQAQLVVKRWPALRDWPCLLPEWEQDPEATGAFSATVQEEGAYGASARTKPLGKVSSRRAPPLYAAHQRTAVNQVSKNVQTPPLVITRVQSSDAVIAWTRKIEFTYDGHEITDAVLTYGQGDGYELIIFSDEEDFLGDLAYDDDFLYRLDSLSVAQQNEYRMSEHPEAVLDDDVSANL